MRYFLLVFLMISSSVYAQLTKKQMDDLHDSTLKIESTTVELNESINRSMHAMDSMNMANFNKQNERNLNAFMEEQKEQQNKAKRSMYLRLGFGIAMLIVLVIGLMRKKKQQP